MKFRCFIFQLRSYCFSQACKICSQHKLPEISLKWILFSLKITTYQSWLTAATTQTHNPASAGKQQGLLPFLKPSTSEIKWSRNLSWQQLLPAKWMVIGSYFSSGRRDALQILCCTYLLCLQSDDAWSKQYDKREGGIFLGGNRG